MAKLVRTSVSIGGSRIPDTDITSLDLQQEIGNHHGFTLMLKQDTATGLFSEKAKAWIGKPVVIGLEIKEDDQIMFSTLKEFFKGVVTQIGISRRTGKAALMVTGASPTVLLDDLPRTRSFTEKGLQQIIDEVTKDAEGGFPKAPEVSPKISKGALSYTVQYRETNYAFLNRMADRFGEWAYYDGLAFYFGQPGGADTVKLDFNMHGLLDFSLSVKAMPAKFDLRGYDYLKHEIKMEAAPASVKSNDMGNEAIKVSTGDVYPNVATDSILHNLDAVSLKTAAKRREEVILDDVVLASGSSRNPNLKLGCIIDVSDEEIGEKYGTYVVTSLGHSLTQGGDYTNSFQAISTEVKTPILRSMARPPSCNPQLAIVTDVADEDSLGRVKVRFLWQEGSEETSPWLRVASSYTGGDKGFYVIPEVDDQVLVAFEEGHPEYPYVLSGMYHGQAVPEWFDKENRYKGLKSRGQNQLKFDDKNKSLMLSAPAEMMLYAGKTITLRTGGKDDSKIILEAGDGTIDVVAHTININSADAVYIDSAREIQASVENNHLVFTPEEVSLKVEKDLKISADKLSASCKSSAEISGGTVDLVGNPINLNS